MNKVAVFLIYDSAIILLTDLDHKSTASQVRRSNRVKTKKKASDFEVE